MGKGRRIRQRRKIHDGNQNRRKRSSWKWITIGALSLIGLGYAIPSLYGKYGKDSKVILKPQSTPSVLSSTLESGLAKQPLQIAKREYTKRQDYLNDILKGSKIPYCSEVVYDHDGSNILNYLKSEYVKAGFKGKSLEDIMGKYVTMFRDGFYDAKTPEVLELSGMDRNSKVFVGRMFFELDSPSMPLMDEEFRHVLIAHEGRHCEQHAKGWGYLKKEEIIEGLHSGLIEERVAYEVAELDANYHGLKRLLSGEFKVSSRFFMQARSEFTKNYLRLQSVLGDSSEVQKRLINNALESVKDLKILFLGS